MKPHVDQLIQCFERITQQLKTLETVFASTSKTGSGWGAHTSKSTKSITDCQQCSASDATSHRIAHPSTPSPDPSFQADFAQTCSQECCSS